MNNISMKTASLIHGDTETMTLTGSISDNTIKFNNEEELTINWTDKSVTISNGLNLELNKKIDSKVNTPAGEIHFKSNLTDIDMSEEHISFTYEVIIDGSVEEKRKIEYRW